MCFSRQIAFLVPFVLATVQPLMSQDAPSPRNGRVEENQYVSATGAFRIAIPVLPALGGSITDTENVVTFQDSFSTHQSIACFKLDAAQHREDETRGRKDYLVWFFANFLEADFEQRFPKAHIESAHFLPNIQSGALLTYNLLPGGSMFPNRTIILDPNSPPVAKRGNLLFVRGDFIFVLSIELAEKAIEGTAFNKTTTEEDAILRKRLTDLLDKITFTDPATPAATSPAK